MPEPYGVYRSGGIGGLEVFVSIFVIRHSDKEPGEFYEDALRFNDQPLSDAGRQKAERLISFFEEIPIDSIYVSEYRRTPQTIEGVASAKNLTPIVDRRLNEIDLGDTEKLTDEQVRETYPEFWNAFLKRTGDFRIPNGETGSEAASRAMELFGSLVRTKNHILVSHDGLIRTLVCAVLTLPPYKRHLFRIRPCSITVFEYLEMFGCWSIPKLNMEL